MISDNGIKTDYISCINRALHFIDDHLDENLSLEIVAEAAFFSPFHFHRIFKAATNETLNTYVNRRRIEKSAAILMYKKAVTISEISLQNGFTSNSSFTRAFKKFYGVSPSEFRRQNADCFSKISKTESKNGQINLTFEKYICNITNLNNWIDMNAKIEIREIPGLELAYVTSIGHQGIAGAYDTLVKWAGPKGILEKPGTKMITIYHDSFKVTDADKVRISACVTLSEPASVTDEVGLTKIEKGRCIVGSFEIGLEDFEKAWNGLFVWMVENGYKKADRNPFEMYHNDFRTHPENRCIVDFFIPVE